MRQQRERILSLDNFCGALESGFNVTFFRAARSATVLWEATGPSSHTTFNDFRALFASHQFSATIATPETHFTFEALSGDASIRKACFTPGSFLISSRFALTALPPKTGHFSYTAYIMSGGLMSMLK